MVVVLMTVMTIMVDSEVVPPTTTTSQTRTMCPEQCYCISETIANCAKSSLDHVPHEQLPHSLRSLDLSGNQIREITNDTLEHFPNLTELDLSGNWLVNISRNAFTGLPSLQRLMLKDNQLRNQDLRFLQHLPSSLQYLDLSSNQIEEFGPEELGNLPNVVTLSLSGNRLTTFFIDAVSTMPGLQTLNLSWNQLTDFSLHAHNISVVVDTKLPLQVHNLSHNGLSSVDVLASQQVAAQIVTLDLANNVIETLKPEIFAHLQNMIFLNISQNPVIDIPPFIFQNCSELVQLSASDLDNLSYIHRDSFSGLHQLQSLNLHSASNLMFIHPYSFWQLPSLQYLDIGYSGLSTLHQLTFQNATRLHTTKLAGALWSCDCETKWLRSWLTSNETKDLFPDSDNINCSYPDSMKGMPIARVPEHMFLCEAPMVTNSTMAVSFRIGATATIDCNLKGNPKPEITWVTPQGVTLEHHPAFIDYSVLQPGDAFYHTEHHWHEVDYYISSISHNSRVTVLRNGSLHIDYVQRIDAGVYICTGANYLGNSTLAFMFTLDYQVLRYHTVVSTVIGFTIAGAVLLITVVVGAIRYVAFVCSQEERQKRKSIRDVIESMTVYKSAQFDRLSAYKTAKIDQLAAKMDQLSAFKSAKIDKIRTYKQMSVASAIHHMERMREHYSAQMVKIKDNCSQQVEKLRDSYGNQLVKFKDYKSHQVERVRDNYNAQLMKVREYGSTHMEKLREQYKLQQQYVLKLLELLDIGNCMSVIEAECIRTESMLFDPNISFDLEAQSVHFPRERRDSSASEEDFYLTASSSNSEASSVVNLQGVTVENEYHQDQRDLGQQKHQQVTTLASGNDAVSSPEGSPVCKHKRRRQKRPSKQSLNCYTAQSGGTHDEEGSICNNQNINPRVTTDDDREGSPMLQHSILPQHGLRKGSRELTPGRESSTTDETSSCYESAHQSREHTPEPSTVSEITLMPPLSRTPSDGSFRTCSADTSQADSETVV